MLDNFGDTPQGALPVDFVFMLTRNDQTVSDCLETWESISAVGLAHAGFKDIGVDLETLRALNKRIQASGALSYLEVVSETPEACLRSASVAVELGVNRLMGGTQVPEILALLEGTGIDYLPFPGMPVGHPTKLGGTAELVAQQCRQFEAAGCAGVDLLAYRATEADPIALVKAARASLTGTLLVAGSVDSTARISALRDAGADAFTVGSAVFNRGSLTARLRDVMDACA
jgi:hypothetical protein